MNLFKRTNFGGYCGMQKNSLRAKQSVTIKRSKAGMAFDPPLVQQCNALMPLLHFTLKNL
jgi:hypothetical protein